MKGKQNAIGLLVLLVVFLFGWTICADESFSEDNSFPSPIGFGIISPVQYPGAEADVMGFRLSLAYGQNANVSGLDFGVFGCRVDGCLFGLQTSAIMNHVGSASGALQIAGVGNHCLEDYFGVQVAGIANMTEGYVYGGQISSFNIARDVSGLQIGAYNQADNAAGIQIGVINYANDMQGIQIGLFNIIRQGIWMPVINMKF